MSSDDDDRAVARIATYIEREAAIEDALTRADLVIIAEHLRRAAGRRSGLQVVEEVRR